jgi:alpha-L-rhamnosidase
LTSKLAASSAVCVATVFVVVLLAVGCGGGGASLPSSPSTVPSTAPAIIQGAFDSATNAAAATSTVPQFGTARACGWAASSDIGVPVAKVQVLLDGQVISNASLGFPRPDVKAGTGRADFLNSGWCAWFDVGALPAGDHQLRAIAFNAAGASVELSPSNSIAITPASAANLDSTVLIGNPSLQSAVHQPLPEQYIWTGAGDSTVPRFFRGAFVLAALPSHATLFVTGANSLNVFVNGQAVAAIVRGIELIPALPMLEADITSFLLVGRNVIAVQAANGTRFAAKLISDQNLAVAPPLLISDSQWKSATTAVQGWEQPAFNDSAWPSATSLGGIESKPEFFEGNADLEMYRWPGYDGISPFLAHARVAPALVRNVSVGKGNVPDPSSFLAASPIRPAIVNLPVSGSDSGDFPSFMLDFGRVIAGRLELASNSPIPVAVQVQFGESAQEALGFPFLGTRQLDIQPGSTAIGPKTAFRFAWVKVVGGPPSVSFTAVDADQVYYPVASRGSFQSSDPVLDRIWMLSVYTAHLCMQDHVWDAPKRDRNPFAGDLYVTAKTIRAAFGDPLPVQNTLDVLSETAVNSNPVRDINDIPGYSALWVASQADEYRWSGDLNYLQGSHAALLSVLGNMEAQLDANGLFQAPAQRWFIFVDWSPGLYLNDAEALEGNNFEFYLGFSEGSWLLRQLGDQPAADHFQAVANKLRAASLALFLDPATSTVGPRWQLNAMAAYSGAADTSQTAAIYDRVLFKTPTAPVTPYFSYYGLQAMSKAGHAAGAVAWLRQYWGGMIALGATSFWELYDPGWPALDIYAAQRDWFTANNLAHTSAYFVSLGHGWASGPAAWLHEHVLGVSPSTPGYRQVLIRPDLAGLSFARGTHATPLGDISVDISEGAHTVRLTVPLTMQVSVSMPVTSGQTTLQVNGQSVLGTSTEGGSRLLVVLPQAATFLIQSQ